MSLLPSRGPDVSTTQEGEMQVVGVDEEVEPLIDALSSDTARAVLNAIYEEPGTPSQIADRLDMSIQKVSYHLDKLEDQDLISVAGTQYSEKGQEMKVFEPPDEPLVLFVGTQERKRSLRALVKRLLPTIGILALGSLAVQRFFDRSGSGGSYLTEAGGDDAGGGDAGGADAADAEPPAQVEEREDVELSQESAGGEAEAPQATETPPEAEADTPAGGGGEVDVALDGGEVTPTPSDVTTEAIDAGAQATEAATGGAGISPGLAFFLGGLLVLSILVAFWAYRTYA